MSEPSPTESSPEESRPFTSVYDELKKLARRHLQRERRHHTLQPTDLVHEVCLRLGSKDLEQEDELRLRATAARAMRRILVDHARARVSAKRGGGGERITLGEELLTEASADVDLLDLDTALEKLRGLDERKARLVELRFFGGLTIEELAHALGVSHMTVSNDWRLARAWLAAELESD